ncbi:ArsR/SmtB family transcription factor [Hyphococcus sp.]|uniref:ArsR/SmtB family transcription factor n=1 Tax=Hyphococcus sp. TaxID=2038636 RepID=UPI002082FF0B|nr:MAG: transcriptional regulator [Marinicaulis sp.]
MTRKNVAAPVLTAPVFAALGDATRLELLSRLSRGEPRSISQLRNGLELTRQGVSKHLRVLEEAGLVASQRIGREQRYTFTPKPIGEAADYLSRISDQWDEAVLRLKAFVED